MDPNIKSPFDLFLISETILSILISNYYSQLPSMSSLGVDAFIPSSNNSNNDSQAKYVVGAEGKEDKDFTSPEFQC